jgi:hypothetical protein
VGNRLRPHHLSLQGTTCALRHQRHLTTSSTVHCRHTQLITRPMDTTQMDTVYCVRPAVLIVLLFVTPLFCRPIYCNRYFQTHTSVPASSFPIFSPQSVSLVLHLWSAGYQHQMRMPQHLNLSSLLHFRPETIALSLQALFFHHCSLFTFYLRHML